MVDKDQYITNITGEEDDDIVNKLQSLQKDLENANNELQQKNKTILDQKHSIDDLTIEIKTLTEKNQSQLNLIKFYEENEDKNQNETEDVDKEKKDKIKELEIKIMKLNDKISDLEAEIIKKDNQLEVTREELDEQVNLGDRLLKLINDKEDEIKDLKEKSSGGEERKKSVEVEKDKDKELTPEEVAELKELFMSQQEEFDEYKATSEKKLKNYSDENMELTKQVSELKQKMTDLEDEASKLRNIKEEFEMEKQMGEEENKKYEENQDNKIQGYLAEINNLRTQLDESKQQLEDNKTNSKESARIERQEYEKIIEDLKAEKEKLEEKLANSEKNDEKPKNDQSEEINSIERAKKEEENNKIIENLSTSVHNLDKQVKEKTAKIDNLNTQISEISKENEELKQTISEFDKVKKELEDKEKRDEKEKNGYVKKIKDLTDKLKSTEEELGDLKKRAETNNTCNLGDMLDDDPNAGLQDQLDEANKELEKLREEIKYYEKQIDELTIEANKGKRASEFEAKNTYLTETVETLKKNIEELNNAKKKADEDFHSQIDSLEIELAGVKTNLAIISYDNDKTMVKYKNYIKKLEGKLLGLGFKFKNKTKAASE